MDYSRLLRDLIIAFLSFATAGWGGLIPEEVLVAGAGIWAALPDNAQDFGAFRYLIIPVMWVGVVFSDGLLYAAGRYYGTRLLRFKFMSRLMPEDKRLRVEHNFQRYGVIILLFGRLVPGIRLPLFLTAGMMRLSIPAFLLSDFLGAILGNSLIFFLTFWFGTQFQEMLQRWERQASAYKPVIIMGVLVGVVAYLLINFIRRPFRTGDPEEVPLIGHQMAVHLPQNEESPASPPQQEAGTPEFVRPVPETLPGQNGTVARNETSETKPDSLGY